MTTMGAPVFDADGSVAMGIFVLAFRDTIPTDRVPDIAERLLKATGAITDSIHGRGPR
jgi:DNA-binding IclR family transcriptional regulator